MDRIRERRSSRNAKEKPPADLRFQNGGSVWLLFGDTDNGRAWIDEMVSDEGFHAFGGADRVVEVRYVQDIMEGAVSDGLSVVVV